MLKQHREAGHTFAHTYYWKLAEVSCVLVLRNRAWFELNVSNFAETWDTILKERKSGYEHRAPKKEQLYQEDKIFDQCLLNINMFNDEESTEKTDENISKDEEPVIETPVLQPPEPPQITETSSPKRNVDYNGNVVMHIRTESIDETVV